VHDLGLNLDWLLKVRLAVGRYGEMDCACWWNTEGQLGPRGAAVLRRGFPRTHHFAQARAVFAVAANRCAEIFDLPGAATLWRLDEQTEDAFDAQWESWLDAAADWRIFFEGISELKPTGLTSVLTELRLIDAADIAAAQTLKVDENGRAVALPTPFDGGRNGVALLALGFDKSEVRRLVVPFAK
jgi:hypothetical protein